MSDSLPNDAPTLLENLEAFSSHIGSPASLDALLTIAIEGLARFFRIEHASLLLDCDDGERLHVIASTGYEASGVGAHITVDRRVVRQIARDRQLSALFEAERAGVGLTTSSNNTRRIAHPAIAQPGSFVVLPLWDGEKLIGAVVLEHKQPGRFEAAEISALNIACRQLALSLTLLLARTPAFPSVRAAFMPRLVSGRLSVITYYAEDDSIVVGGDFVISGMAGAMLWRLLSGYVEANDTQAKAGTFVELPTLPANTELLLVLLSRRLSDCLDFIRLKPIAAGSFILEVDREITLLEIPK